MAGWSVAFLLVALAAGALSRMADASAGIALSICVACALAGLATIARGLRPRDVRAARAPAGRGAFDFDPHHS